MSATTFIYALCEPETRRVRYIGKTDNLKSRFSKHLNESAKKKTHLGNWLRSLAGEKPALVVLHEVAEGESWAEEERRYISCARALGMDLVNLTDGGEGVPGHVPTPEHRAAISTAHTGVPHSPERCAAISATRKGVPLSPEHCAALSAGWTPERRAAKSAAQNGVPRSTESRATQSAAQTGVPWTVARRAAYERRWGRS